MTAKRGALWVVLTVVNVICVIQKHNHSFPQFWLHVAPPSTTTAASMVHKRLRRISLEELTDNKTMVCPPNTFPVYDSPGNATIMANVHNYTIPMAIHQSCKSRCVSLDFYQLTLEWKKLGIPYYFHDDEALERLIMDVPPRAEFPNLRLVWSHCIPKPIFKADIWRLVLLYEYGGIYADLDAKPIEFTLQSIAEEDQVFVTGFPSFHFMASMPQHPYLFYLLHYYLQLVQFSGDWGVFNAAKQSTNAVKNGITEFIWGSSNMKEQMQQLEKNEPYNFSSSKGYTLRRTGVGRSEDLVISTPFKHEYKQQLFNDSGVQHYASKDRTKVGIKCMSVLRDLFQNATS